MSNSAEANRLAEELLGLGARMAAADGAPERLAYGRASGRPRGGRHGLLCVGGAILMIIGVACVGYMVYANRKSRI